MQTASSVRRPVQGDGDGPAIVVQNLVITYGSLRAVDDLSFSVQSGEIFALLGPNGAGKTSTVEMLEGYRRPDSGTVRVLDYDPISQGHEMKEQIGLMLQQTALYQKIKVREAIDLFTSYYDHPKPAAELIELAGLQKHRDATFDSLSGGQKQRLSLALAMAGNPRVAFLDEPTASMDPQARLQTWELIQGLRQSGVTVLLTTHYMEEAQHLADHVAIIDHGKLVALGTPEELVGASATETISFTGPEGIALKEFQGLTGVQGAQEVRPGVYNLTTSQPLDCVEALAGWRRGRQVELGALRVSGASLEDVFLQLTGQEVRD